MPAIAWSEWTRSGKRVIKQKSFHSEQEVDRFIARKMKTDSFIEVVAGR